MRNMLTETRNRHFAERLFYADNLPQSATACYNGNIAALRIDQHGYTKHYFMGAERFCTTIGGGNQGNWLVDPYDYLTQHEKALLEILKDSFTYRHFYYDPYDYPYNGSHTVNTDYTNQVHSGDAMYDCYQYKAAEQYYDKISLEFKYPFAQYFHDYYVHGDEDTPFYYHSDHLGSASWITDKYGLPAQYIMYAPYGEERLNQIVSFNERFTFTGKEKDEETGYYYFGARNYLPAFSVWGAVDPLADKYIYNSPYVYCEGNPIKYIDPDGKEKINEVYKTDAIQYQGAENFIDNSNTSITFISHGSPQAINAASNPNMSAKEFVDYLEANSSVWQNTEDKSTLTIVLLACYTGQGENSIAQQISKLLPDVTIIAPTEEVKAFSVGDNLKTTTIWGVYVEETQWEDRNNPECGGQWGVFKNGELKCILENPRVGTPYHNNCNDESDG